MTTEQKLAIDYLYNHLMTVEMPDIPNMDKEQRQNSWDNIKEEHRLMMADMILGYSKGHPAFIEILEQKKKNHSDTSFGMIVKGILNQYKC